MNLRELARESSVAAGRDPAQVRRNHAADTWGWMWPDTLRRLVSFGLAALAYARFHGGGAESVGLTAAHWRRDLLLGAAVGIPMAATASAFRAWAIPGYRLPTAPDQALQSFYYVAMNAPVEEVFWRGMLQKVAIEGAERIVGPGVGASAAGWAVATAGFGAFHGLGGDWPWRAVVAATAAGGAFGLVYLLQPKPRSILPSIIVHGLATAGLLSWGDLVLHRRAWRTWHKARGKMGV